MAKRKFGASIIILCIAAITLISGTYAWFLVGGFAELFDIGFDVIEAKGGVLLRGDAGTYGGGKKDNSGWGDKLEREDFKEMSFIKKDGRYKPISTDQNVNRFIAVSMESDKFICDGYVKGKADDGILAEDICYNDFTFYIKSTAEEIPEGAYIKLKLTGDTFDENGNVVKNEDDKGAAPAARVSLTFKPTSSEADKTTIYAIDDDNYNGVTQIFESRTITDAEVKDGEGNYIIDSADTNYTAAGLVAITPVSMFDGDGNEVKISLGNIPGVDQDFGYGAGNGKEVTVRIWLEGNDPQCIAFGDGAVAGKSLMSYITFGVDE